MNILNVSPFYQITVKGLIIVLAISIYELRRRSSTS
jgi:ribose/xylose/arabinose/galactoside ABC-type transport system permease subunit